MVLYDFLFHLHDYDGDTDDEGDAWVSLIVSALYVTH